MIELLYAEDSAPMRASVLRALKPNTDFNITSVPDGTEAIENLRRIHFDVLLTDNHMPGATGLEVISFAKALAQPPKALILYTSDTTGITPDGFYVFDKGVRIGEICKFIREKLDPAI